MTKGESVVVHIGGQRYVIRSDADPTYVRHLAQLVDDRLSELGRAARSTSPQRLAVLTALNIADDLFQEQAKLKRLKKDVTQKSQGVLAYLAKEEKRLL